MSNENEGPYTPNEWCAADPDVMPRRPFRVTWSVDDKPAEVMPAYLTEWRRWCTPGKDGQHITRVCIRGAWTPPPPPEPKRQWEVNGVKFRLTDQGTQLQTKDHARERWRNITNWEGLREALCDALDSHRYIGPLRKDHASMTEEIAEIRRWAQSGIKGCAPYTSMAATMLAQLDKSFTQLRDIEQSLRYDLKDSEDRRREWQSASDLANARADTAEAELARRGEVHCDVCYDTGRCACDCPGLPGSGVCGFCAGSHEFTCPDCDGGINGLEDTVAYLRAKAVHMWNKPDPENPPNMPCIVLYEDKSVVYYTGKADVWSRFVTRGCGSSTYSKKIIGWMPDPIAPPK